METLAYVHCASAYEESVSIESISDEGNASLFDGVNWKKFSSTALLGLLPLVMSAIVIAPAEQAQAYRRHYCGGSRCYPVHLTRYKTIKVKVVKIHYYYKRIPIRVKRLRCRQAYHHRRVVKVVCYKCYKSVSYLY